METPINKDVCAHCNRPLVECDEVHAVEGYLFCSKDCAINSCIDQVIDSAKEHAAEWYNAYAEIVTPADIGILKN